MSTTLLRSRILSTSPRSGRRLFSSSKRRDVDFTYAVIGGGVVGLSIARQLAAREGTSTLLIERHGSVGTETSSRNSEVIHAGLYYGPDSLKTKLCIRGKHLLYELCKAHNIPHRNTKKWIVAQDDQQMAELEKVHALAKSLDVPARYLSRREIEDGEPDVRAEAGVLESASTGIVDSHSLMAFLEGDLQARGGECIFHTAVTRIELLSADDGSDGYLIYTKPYPPSTSPNSISPPTEEEETEEAIEVSTVINSAGLNAIPISNLILPPSSHLTAHYAKGTYFSYSSSHPRPKTLIYPAPVPGLGGLGTHLTLDMAGRLRFGPDVEWVSSPDDLTPSPGRLEDAIAAIRTYLPAVRREAIHLDYCGIRPKLGRSAGTQGKGFADFYIREESSVGRKGFVNLLGIESPGLTSSLAIGEMVERLVYGSEE